MRKVSIILLTLVLLISLVPLYACNEASNANSPEPTPVDYFTFEPNSDRTGYILTGTQKILPADVVIPAEYAGLPVTEIGTGAFEGCTEIERITIPGSVRILMPSCFSNCQNLKSVNWYENNKENYILSCLFPSNRPITLWLDEIKYNPNSSYVALFTSPDGWFSPLTDFSSTDSTISEILSYQQSVFYGAFDSCVALSTISYPTHTYIFPCSFRYCSLLVL